MSNKKTTTIEQLNSLLANTKESVKGFTKASELVESEAMKKYFLEKADRRSAYSVEIETAIRAIGGMAEDQELVLGTLHRAWMDIKSAFATDDNKAMLEECKRGDENCLEDYRTILKSADLPASARNVLNRQQDEVVTSISAFKQLQSVDM